MIQVGANTFINSHYDLDKSPPDWKAAYKHSWACRPGRSNEHESKRLLCPCCMNYITKLSIPYSEDVKELNYLGSGFPLFYNFLKFCIIMLAILLADSCIISGYLSTQYNYCSSGTNPHCVYGLANSISYITSDSATPVRLIINCVSFAAQLFLLLLMRQTQNSLTIYYDERTHRISDFTVKIKNLPTGFDGNRPRIEYLIRLKCPSIVIQSMLLVNKSHEYDEKLKYLRRLNLERSHSVDTDSIQAKILNAHYNQASMDITYAVRMIELNESGYFTGIVFVTVNTKLERDELIKYINQLSLQEVNSAYPNVSFKGNKPIKAIKARYPSEIIWENIQKPKKERSLALVGGWILTVIFISVLTIAFFFMIKARSHFIEVSVTSGDSYEYAVGIFMGYFTIALIILLNKFLLPPVCHLLTDVYKHTNYNEFEFSFALKYTLGMFFTTALMTLAVEAIVFKNYYSSKFGVVEAESYVFILNAFVPPIVWAINPYYIIARYKQKKKYGSEELTQEYANYLMYLPAYSMGKRYADTVKTMWFTFVYVGIIPLGAGFSLLGIILYFFVDKYVLLRKSSVKSSVSSHLANYMMLLLDFTLLFKSLGELFFDLNLRHEMRISTLVMLGVSVVYLLLPLNLILNKLFPEKTLKHIYTYEELKDSFEVTYINSYPMNKSKQTVMMDTILSSRPHNAADLAF